MAAINLFRHGWADRRKSIYRLAIRVLLLSVFAAAVFAADAQCSQVLIKDINNTLSATEKASLVKLVEKQVILHRAHSNFKTPVVLNIRLFSSAKDYKEFQRKHSKGTSGVSSAGYYSPKTKEIVVNGTKKDYFKFCFMSRSMPCSD